MLGRHWHLLQSSLQESPGFLGSPDSGSSPQELESTVLGKAFTIDRNKIRVGARKEHMVDQGSLNAGSVKIQDSVNKRDVNG